MVNSFLTFGLLSVSAIGVSGTTVVQTNDDGWAVANIRAHFDAFQSAGYDVRLFHVFSSFYPYETDAIEIS